MSDVPRRVGVVSPNSLDEALKRIDSMTLSSTLRNSVLETQNLISRMPPILEPLKIDLPPNPIVRTNAILENLSSDIRRMVTNTEQQAEIFKSLAHTANLSLAEAASSSADAKRATNLTKLGVWIAAAAVMVSTFISIWGILDARHNGNASDKKLEALVDVVGDLSKIEANNGASATEYLKALTEAQRQQVVHSTRDALNPKQKLNNP